MKLLEVYNSLLTELGTGTANPYDFHIKKDFPRVVQMRFTTEDDDEYHVTFDKLNLDDNHWQVKFALIGDELNYTKVINKGKIYKVMSTIVKIIELFYEKKDPDLLYIHAVDKRREGIYIKYIKHFLPPQYRIRQAGGVIEIIKKS